MIPETPGDGYRFLTAADRADGPRKGDEYWDPRRGEWREINEFWRRQFGNGGQQLERRPTVMSWSFDNMTTTWVGVTCTDVGTDDEPLVVENEVVIFVTPHGRFLVDWQVDGSPDNDIHATLWDAIGHVERGVEEFDAMLDRLAEAFDSMIDQLGPDDPDK